LAPTVRGEGLGDFVAWLLWPGVALMTGSALTGVLLQVPGLLRGARDLSSVGRSRGRWLLALMLACGAVGIIGHLAFDVPWPASVAALALALVLSAASARATGETDIALVTQLGQLTALTVGGASAGRAAVPLLAGATVSGS